MLELLALISSQHQCTAFKQLNKPSVRPNSCVNKQSKIPSVPGRGALFCSPCPPSLGCLHTGLARPKSPAYCGGMLP